MNVDTIPDRMWPSYLRGAAEGLLIVGLGLVLGLLIALLYVDTHCSFAGHSSWIERPSGEVGD